MANGTRRVEPGDHENHGDAGLAERPGATTRARRRPALGSRSAILAGAGARSGAWAGAAGFFLVVALAGCTHDRPLRVELGAHVQRPDVGVVLLFVDSLGQRQLDAHLAAGTVPNIRRYLWDRGTHVRHAFSCVPSITYANTL